jgi:hypothetical protein
VVAVGEQDPIAEDPVLEPGSGAAVGAPGQAQFGALCAGEGGGEDLVDPAGFADRGDLGSHGVAVAAGFAAGQAGL